MSITTSPESWTRANPCSSIHIARNILHTVRKQSHRTTILRNPYRQRHHPNPKQLRVPLITITNDPRIPLRNTRRRLQLSTHGVKPARTLLLRAQSDGLWTRWVFLVGAHVDIEGQILADTERDAVGFDDGSVGVGFLRLVDKGDVVYACGVCFGVTHYVPNQRGSSLRINDSFVMQLTKDIFKFRRLAFALLEIAAEDDLLSILSSVIEWC